MQNKYKKNLYKILFIVILLSFIISLSGCDWFPDGLFGILDPWAKIIVEYTLVDLTEGAGTISLEIYSLNGVGFNAFGFSYDYYYYTGSTKVIIFSKVVEANFYVEPSDSPGAPGPITTIENLPLYFQDLLDWLTLHPLVTEVDCDLNLIGIDTSNHYQTIQVASNLPVLQPGIDFYPPTAVITTTPAAENGTITGIAPLTVYFDAYESTDVGSGIVSFGWDFGDETTGAGITVNRTYDIPGSYIVTLTVTDLYGNEGYDTVTITVNEPEPPTAVITTVPIAVSGAVTGTAPFEVYFDAYESTSEAEIVSYAWDFGDGSSGTGITTNHTYSNIGTYTVILIVTDSNDKKGYDSIGVTVEKAPIAKINTTPAAVDGTVNVSGSSTTVYFDAYESTSESGIVSYEWDFGDGSSGTGITTNHTYSADGTYTVILTITDSNGYEAYDSVIVEVADCGC